MYFLFRIMNYPLLVNLGTNFLKAALKLGLPVKSLIKQTIFRQFCGGESISDCHEKSLQLSQFGIRTILDYSVEGTEREQDYERTAKELHDVVEKAGIDPKNPYVVFKPTGIGSSSIMSKIQEGKLLSDSEHQAWEKTRQRVRSICKSAFDRGVKVMIDAEESWIQDAIDNLTYEMMREFNQSAPVVFNTYQMYRRDMYENLQLAFTTAASEDYFLGVKLVRGAYMEKERERAQELVYTDPIQPNKEASDNDFNRALKFCIENLSQIGLCCGTHNENSNLYLTELMEQHGISRQDHRVYFAQLYGMSDNISFNLANAGYNVAKYLPYGPVEDVIPYLFRRAEENTAISGQSSREYILIKNELVRRAGAAGSS